MPSELPPVDLEHPSDLDFMVQAVYQYALESGRERLARRGRGGKALEKVLEQALGRVRDHGSHSGCMPPAHGSCRTSP